MRAGFGAGVITPPLPVMLAGFSGRDGPATEVYDDLEARAVLLSSGGTSLCLVICDLLGMSRDFADPVRSAVAEALGIPLAAVLTSCTHTHQGPNAIAGAEALGWPTPDGYLDILVRGCVGAALDARANAEDAELHLTQAALPRGVSMNRRGNPYRPTFSVVDARTPRGDRLGTLSNVSIHPVALGRGTLAVSPDWIGHFRQAIEASGGGRAALLSGALGDVNPHLHENEEGSFDDARIVGEGVATAVSGALGSAEPLGDGVGVVSTREIEVPVEGMLVALAGMGPTMPVELVEWQVGGARLVSVPGEAFHAMGRAIEASRDAPVLLAGLAPVWQGYLPEPYEDGGYEETVSYGRAAVDAIRAALVAAP